MTPLEEPQADALDREVLFARFQEMVMRPAEDGHEARIVKWTDPVNVQVFGAAEKSLLDTLTEKIQVLARYLDHDIRFDTDAPANMTFLFTPNVFEDAKGRARPAALTLMQKNEGLLKAFLAAGEQGGLGCHSQLFANVRTNRMIYSVAFISTDRPEGAPINVDAAWCFWVLLFKGMGFLGELKIHAGVDEPQSQALARHTELTNLFARFLYRDDVVPGMEASTVRPLFMDFVDAEDLRALARLN